MRAEKTRAYITEMFDKLAKYEAISIEIIDRGRLALRELAEIEKHAEKGYKHTEKFKQDEEHYRKATEIRLHELAVRLAKSKYNYEDVNYKTFGRLFPSFSHNERARIHALVNNKSKSYSTDERKETLKNMIEQIRLKM
jgi:hypothetical protein